MSKFRNLCTLLALFSVAPAAAVAQLGTSTTGTSIAINFGADDVSMAPGQIAGFFPRSNWNNATDGVPASSSNQGSIMNLVQTTGGTPSASTADVSWQNFDITTGLGGDFNFGSAFVGDNNTMMTAGHFARGAAPQNVVTVSDIPFDVYDVYIYSQQGPTANGRDSQFTIGSESIFLSTIDTNVFDQATGTSAADPNRVGNFVYFDGLTGDSFTLAVAGFGAANQTAIMGIQIVDQTQAAVPEPGTAALWASIASLTIGMAWLRSRRRVDR